MVRRTTEWFVYDCQAFKTKTLPSSKRGRQERSKSRQDQDDTENRGDDPADQQRDDECSESYHRYQNAKQRQFESCKWSASGMAAWFSGFRLAIKSNFEAVVHVLI
jgi:hypothetical protein